MSMNAYMGMVAVIKSASTQLAVSTVVVKEVTPNSGPESVFVSYYFKANCLSYEVI